MRRVAIFVLALALPAWIALSLLVVLGRVRYDRRQEARVGDLRPREAVRLIQRAYDEEPVIVSTVETLLAFDYPEHEVIVVNDGSSDGTLEKLREAYELEPYELFVRRVFESAEVRAIYRSASHPNLIVVDKANGGKADAWNAGLNVARYRYVCGVDADTLFDRKALLKGMRLVVQDPGRVIGVTSHLNTAREPERAITAAPGRRPIDLKPLIAFQHLDFVRAFFNNRIAWSRLRFMLCSPRSTSCCTGRSSSGRASKARGGFCAATRHGTSSSGTRARPPA